MSIHIIPFHNEWLSQAGELLARRHRSDRAALPELPSRFEAPAVARAAIEAALKRKHASGFAALDGGRLVAYLIGDLLIDEVWGRSAWVRTPGCAYDPADGVEIVRDLYAALGIHWVGYGAFSHFTLLPISDPALIHAWFSLSFGIEQIHALIDLEALNPAIPAILPEIEVRKAGPGDRQHLADLSNVIWRHQVKAPVWGIQMPEAIQETREGWAELVDETDVTVWLAFQAGKVVSSQGYWPAVPSDDNLLIPEKSVRLSVAGTREEARGKGINTLLTRYGLAHAHASGYRCCETDWRSTNLLAARFWPRQGFRPVAYRLVRRIDPRIAWANGTAPEQWEDSE